MIRGHKNRVLRWVYFFLSITITFFLIIHNLYYDITYLILNFVSFKNNELKSYFDETEPRNGKKQNKYSDRRIKGMLFFLFVYHIFDQIYLFIKLISNAFICPALLRPKTARADYRVGLYNSSIMSIHYFLSVIIYMFIAKFCLVY